MARKPTADATLKNKAFLTYLLEPVNTSIYNSTLEIESLVDLLHKVTDEASFKQMLQILTDISNHQLALAQHLATIVKSMSAEPSEQQKLH